MKSTHHSTEKEREISVRLFPPTELGPDWARYFEMLESDPWHVKPSSRTAASSVSWGEQPYLTIGVTFSNQSTSERILRLQRNVTGMCEIVPGAERYMRGNVTTSCTLGAVPEMRKGHILRNEKAVLQFLGAHPELLPVLLEGRDQIPRFFGGDAKLELDVIMDPEADDYAQLFVYVVTSLAPDDILERFELFDREWFLDKMIVTGDLLCYSPVIR